MKDRIGKGESGREIEREIETKMDFGAVAVADRLPQPVKRMLVIYSKVYINHFKLILPPFFPCASVMDI